MPDERIAVQLTRQAEKDLDKLKHDREGAVREISKLEGNPFLGHPLTGSLREARALSFTLKGGGACRAVYVVYESTTCILFILGSHENIYKRALSRL